ncbi:hypothetical protein OG948_48695 (plasmid) [Embleya sp. NBC_00888]|uniref:hypothetical protein n=1 Tax=Embleya sp. NBC_00888 TaxID=2975960 RepID=UPI002F90BF81|nr:hypothetical protein OG948_48695 [Embleya sp. NBC_00888]
MSRLARAARALRAGGLERVWAARYPPLREPDAAEAARTHVVGSVAALSPPYRGAFTLALRMVPLCFRLVTGRRLAGAPAQVLLVGATRLERVPLVGTVVRASGTLACYGGLDGLPTAARDPLPAAGTPDDPRERTWTDAAR